MPRSIASGAGCTDWQVVGERLFAESNVVGAPNVKLWPHGINYQGLHSKEGVHEQSSPDQAHERARVRTT
jgi:hypothetical protein